MHEKVYLGHVAISVKLRRAVWEFVRLCLFRPMATKLFRLWRIALLRLFGAKVSWEAEVYASAHVWAPWNLHMEEGACLGPHVNCYNQAKVVLGQDCCVSQEACLCTAGHQVEMLNNAKTSLVVANITLHEGAWVGMRAFIGPGVEVGAHAVVGAMSGVFRDVPIKTVVGGNPATVLKEIV